MDQIATKVATSLLGYLDFMKPDKSPFVAIFLTAIVYMKVSGGEFKPEVNGFLFHVPIYFILMGI